MEENVSSVNQRVRLFMKSYRLSVNYLSKVLNVPQPTLHRQLGDDGMLNIESLQAILIHYPELSADWLLLGNGEMIRNNKEVKSKSENNDASTITLLKELLDDERSRSREYWDLLQKLINK